MLREERLREIEDMLKSNGMVEVAKLSRLFNVTEMTIRRDLDDLVQRKIAVRSHGGAMLPRTTCYRNVPMKCESW